jgi:glycosyltransferase involved in cell wall biosynthesis
MEREMKTTTEMASPHRVPINLEDHSWPRIALVTPVFNSEKYIEQAICSVLAQGYPNLNYFIVDGGSTDGTLDVIRKYENQISGWLSEPDYGMYDAINKGFARTSGEIMGWISGTDKLQPDGLTVVGSVFRDLPEVEWITGRRTVYNDEGMTIRIDPVMYWSRLRFLIGGSLRHIQQESTYWRRSLWEKAGAHVDASRRAAGDFELWVRYFRHAPLYSVDALIGGFREHPDSGSLVDLAKFNALCDEIAETELRAQSGPWFRPFKTIDSYIRRIPKVRAFWYKGKSLSLRLLYSLPGSAPIIVSQGGQWRKRGVFGRKAEHPMQEDG